MTTNTDVNVRNAVRGGFASIRKSLHDEAKLMMTGVQESGITVPSSFCDITDDEVTAYINSWGGTKLIMDTNTESLYMYTYDVQSIDESELLTLINQTMQVCSFYLLSITYISTSGTNIYQWWATRSKSPMNKERVSPIERLVLVCIDICKRYDEIISRDVQSHVMAGLLFFIDAVNVYLYRSKIADIIDMYIKSGSALIGDPDKMTLPQHKVYKPEKEKDEHGDDIPASTYDVVVEDSVPMKDVQFSTLFSKKNDGNEPVTPALVVCNWLMEHLRYVCLYKTERTLWACESDRPKYTTIVDSESIPITERMEAFKKLLQFSLEPENVVRLCKMLNTGNLFVAYYDDRINWIRDTWIPQYKEVRSHLLEEDRFEQSSRIEELDKKISDVFGPSMESTDLKVVVDSYFNLLRQKSGVWESSGKFKADVKALPESGADPLIVRLMGDWVAERLKDVSYDSVITRIVHRDWFASFDKSFLDMFNKRVWSKYKGVKPAAAVEQMSAINRHYIHIMASTTRGVDGGEEE